MKVTFRPYLWKNPIFCATRERVENSGEPEVMVISSTGPLNGAGGDITGMMKKKTSPKITISKNADKIGCNFRLIIVMRNENW